MDPRRDGTRSAPAAARGADSAGTAPSARRAPLAALAGPALSTYTAVLVANTAVPVWHEARRELPFVFAASAAASAGAAARSLTPRASAGPARRLAIAGGARRADRCARRWSGGSAMLGEPYHEGTPGRLARPRRHDRRRRRDDGESAGGAAARSAIGAALLLAGAACERWAVFKAGFASARDPAYTVGATARPPRALRPEAVACSTSTRPCSRLLTPPRSVLPGRRRAGRSRRRRSDPRPAGGTATSSPPEVIASQSRRGAAPARAAAHVVKPSA